MGVVERKGGFQRMGFTGECDWFCAYYYEPNKTHVLVLMDMQNLNPY